MTDQDPLLDDDLLPMQDDETHYRGALIAYRSMLDELYESMQELLPAATTTVMQRYKTALDGVFAARANLDRAQYKRITRIVVNEQRAVGRRLDLLTSKIEALAAGGDSRDLKLDEVLRRLAPPPLPILQDVSEYGE